MEVLTLIPDSRLLGFNRTFDLQGVQNNVKIRLMSFTTLLEGREFKSSSPAVIVSIPSRVNSVNSVVVGGVGLGLRNLGNTCFMNCILQCLSHAKSLVVYCDSGDYKADINRSSSSGGDLMTAFAKLIEILSSGDDVTSPPVTPSDFKSQIGRSVKQFGGHSQHDAHEFLSYLLESLHEELNRAPTRIKRHSVISSLSEAETPITAVEAWKKYLSRNDSKIVDLFVGVLRSTLTCDVCQHESHCFEPFLNLSLPVDTHTTGATDTSPRSVTLQDCIELFVRQETLDADNRPECGRCKRKQRSTKGFSIDRFPPVLVLHLKRFNHTATAWSKLSTDVRCPLHKLDLTRYATRTNNMSAVYNLFAVGNHAGSPNNGHYTAFARHLNTEDWYSFDDAAVHLVDPSAVVSSDAYILFYELSDTTSSRL